MESTTSLTRVVYADPYAVRQLYFDLRRIELSDLNAGFSTAETQVAADLLTQARFMQQNDSYRQGLFFTYEGFSLGTEPLISQHATVTARILPRLMLDLEEVITRPGVYDGECREQTLFWQDKQRPSDLGSGIFGDMEVANVTCTGPLKISIKEAADMITLSAMTTVVTAVELRPTLTPSSKARDGFDADPSADKPTIKGDGEDTFELEVGLDFLWHTRGVAEGGCIDYENRDHDHQRPAGLFFQ